MYSQRFASNKNFMHDALCKVPVLYSFITVLYLFMYNSQHLTKTAELAVELFIKNIDIRYF